VCEIRMAVEPSALWYVAVRSPTETRGSEIAEPLIVMDCGSVSMRLLLV
jgi:hypothetical protein